MLFNKRENVFPYMIDVFFIPSLLSHSNNENALTFFKET